MPEIAILVASIDSRRELTCAATAYAEKAGENSAQTSPQGHRDFCEYGSADLDREIATPCEITI
jgi:hypothetical protein